MSNTTKIYEKKVNKIPHHNITPFKQGGDEALDEFYHLTSDQVDKVDLITISGDGTKYLRDDGTYDTVSGAGDEKVKYDAGDPTAGYVADKIIAGDGISVEEGTGGDANKLVITNTDKGSDVNISGKEDVANKETSSLDTSTTKYPCNKIVKDAINDIVIENNIELLRFHFF
jgi:hypothetical protein